jgi:glycosyltransferase involved in cell wall biosynthesis
VRVLNVNKYYQLTGGGDRFFFESANILTENGHEVVPFCLDYPSNLETPYAKYFPEGVRGVDLGRQTFAQKTKLFFNGIYSIPAKKALHRMLQEIRPDVAHLHVLHFGLSPSVIDALDDAGVPIVFSLHDYRVGCAAASLYTHGEFCVRCSHNRFYHAIRYRCYRGSVLSSTMATLGNYLYRLKGTYDKVDVFTVPHEDMAELVVKLGVPRDRIALLNNPLPWTEAIASRPLENYALYFGNLIPEKGVFTLMRAAARIPELPLKICGRGAALDALRAEKVRLGASHVEVDEFTRWGSGLQEFLAGARFVVSPSEWPTPLEYSTVESMAFGKAIVASRIGGNKFVVEDGITGTLFEPGNDADLEKAMRPLAADPARCSEMGRLARQRFERLFTRAGFYAQLTEAYGRARESRERRAQLSRR